MTSVEVLKRLKFTEINRTRRLPVPGKVLVELGDVVQPRDVIAEAKMLSKVYILDIAWGLGVQPSEAASCMMRDLGEVVLQEDVIAQHSGNLPRLVRAPVGGKLLDWQDGRLTLASEGKKEYLKAGMIGEVAEVIMHYGAVLKTCGSLIQGVWGNGHLGSGELTLLDPKLESHIEEVMLDYFNEGQVLAAGHCLSRDHLEALADRGISGLILCSLSPELIQTASQQPYPIIVLQGFGRIPPDALSVALLSDCAGKVVSLNACKRDRDQSLHPEVIIPLRDDDFEEGNLAYREELEVGQWVQICGGAANGQTGEVIELTRENMLFESGVNVPAASVRLDKNEKITIPVENLVILSHSRPA